MIYSIMYAIYTTQGKYAIKTLNPQIMLRPVAMQHFINSERIVSIAANKISALPAKIINGTFMQNIENQFYLVFDWINGKSLKRSLGIECTDVEEQQMGTAQVTGTINDIRHYADMICEIENWLNNEI